MPLRPTTGRARSLRRATTALLSMTLLVSALPAAPAWADPPDPLAELAADGLADFARAADALGQLSPLADTIPGTATSAAQLVGFDAGFVAAALREPLMAVERTEDFTDDLGTLIVGSEYRATIDATAVETAATGVSPRQLDITLAVSAERTVDVPLGYVDPEAATRDPDDPDDQAEPLDLTGGTVPVTATAEGTFEFVATETDNGDGSFTYAFWMQGEPSFTVTVDGEDDALHFDGRYGFTDIDVTGSVIFDDIAFDASFVDPNEDGTITQAELAETLGADLFAAAFTAGDLDLDLDLGSDLLGGEGDGGLTASEDGLGEAGAYPAVGLTKSEDLAQFATITADDALLGVGQAGVALRAMVGTAGTRLPFLDGFVTDLYDPGKALFDFAEARANAVIVCGSADTVPPSGRLVEGGVAYCQAIAGNEAQTVEWSGTPTNKTDTATVGAAPTKNVKYTDVELPLDISVQFTEVALETIEENPQAEPPTYTVVPRFATAQEMVAQLEVAGFEVTAEYEGGALRLPLGHETASKSIEVPFDVGDLLRPGSNLRDVTAADGAPVTVGMTGGELAATLGITMGELDDVRFVEVAAADAADEVDYVAVPAADIGKVPTRTGDALNTRSSLAARGVTILEDPFILEKRFTIAGDADTPIISVDRIDVGPHTADFDARIGMLPVVASTDDFTVASGGPALAVDAPADGAPVQITELVAGGLDEVVVAVDLDSSLTLDVVAEGLEQSGGGDIDGELTVDWDDVASTPLPSVVPDTAYARDLQPFDIRATVGGVVTAAGTPATTTLVDGNADFLGAFGLTADVLPLDVQAPLFNTTQGTMCGAFTILSATSLRCDEPLAGGVDLEEIDLEALVEDEADLPVFEWAAGDGYEVPGDPEALRRAVVESLVQVTALLDNHTNPAFNDKLPLLDIAPDDAVTQLGVVSAALGQLLTDIDAYGEEREGDTAVTGTTPEGSGGAVKPAPEAPWATLPGLVEELQARLADACDDDEACAGPVSVDAELSHRSHDDAPGDIAYLDLVVTGLGSEASSDVPLRIDLGDGLTLIHPDDGSQDPFRSEVVTTSDVELGIGIPLARGIPATDTLVLDGTGVTDLTMATDEHEVDLVGAIGAVGLNVGEAATLDGTHADLDIDVDGMPTTATIEVGDVVRHLDDPATCTVASTTGTTLTCIAPMADVDGERVIWAPGSRFAVHAPAAKDSGEAAASSTVLSVDGPVDVESGDVVVRDEDGQACVVTASTEYVAEVSDDPDADEDESEDAVPATVTCAVSPVEWREGDAFSIHLGRTSGAYTSIDNDSVVYDPATDFVALGVEAGTELFRVDGDGDRVGSCVIDAVDVDGSPNRLSCDGLDSGQWRDGDAYELGGVGILRLSLSGSLVVEDDVAVGGLLGALVGTLEGEDHPICEREPGGDETTEACAKLSLELSTVPEPEDGEDAAQSYLGIIDVSVDVARTEPEGPSGASALSSSTASAEPVLTDEQVEALGIAPLDWSLLPATTPHLAFLMGDALDGSAVGTRLPLVGAELDAGAGVEQKLLDLSSALGDVGYDLDEVLDDYDGDDVRAFITANVTAAVRDAADGSSLLEDDVDVTVEVVCGGSTAGDCEDAAAVDDVKVSFTVGEEGGTGRTGFETGLPGLQTYADEDEATGGPSGNIETEYDWSLDLTFGIDRLYGPYIAGGSGEEFELSGTAGIGEDETACPEQAVANPSTIEDYAAGFDAARCIQGRFGLLKGTMFDAQGDMASDLEIRALAVSLPRVDPSDPKLTFADLIDGVEAALEVDARGTINLLLQTADPLDPDFPMALPSLLTVFQIDYDSEIGDTLGKGDWYLPSCYDEGANQDYCYAPRRKNGWTSPAWYDAVMDLGPFVESLLGPVLGEVSSVAKPLKPVIDIVSAPIPVLTDLHQAVGRGPLTMLDVLEQVSGNDLTLLRRILASMQLAANLPDGSDRTLYIRLDSATDWSGGFAAQPNPDWEPNFTVDVEDVEEEPCDIPEGKRSCKKTESDWKNGQGKSTYDSIKKSENGKVTRHASGSVEASGAGITFPFLDDVRQVYGLFVGVDATLVRVDAGTLSATAGMTFSFGPFMAGPVPVEVQLGGAITLNGRFAMGYDTRGFSRLVVGEEAMNSSYLLDGLFIDDLDATGKDVNEIELIVSVSAGASASLKIIKVGLEAVVTVTVGLNFNDPDKNGKLYLEEVMLWLENPICLFDVRGTLEFVLQLFFELNLFVKKVKFTQTLYKLKPPLVLFEFSCSPPPPVWARQEGSDLVLHVGDDASRRGQFTAITNEKFTVRQVGPTGTAGTPVEVTAFGIPLEYTIPPNGKLIAHTGGGNDTVRLLPGQDEEGNEHRFERDALITSYANGSSTTLTAGANRFEGGDGADHLVGGNGKDVLRGGAGDDILEGKGENDTLDGGTGLDLLYGGDGDDRLLGGPGRDLLHGGAGADNLDGGPGLRAPAPRDRQGNVRNDLLDPGNLLVGGAGDDTLNGGPVTDYLFGDDVMTGASTSQSLGSSFSADRRFLDSVFVSTGATRATWCANAGSIAATGGSNTLAGHDGDDYLFGGKGADVAEGGRGDDLLCTGAGPDQLHGGKGVDELWGGAGDDRLDGGVGDDKLHGGADRDLLTDKAGANVLVGGQGPDQLIGSDTASLYVGDDLGVRAGANVNRFGPGDVWPVPTADLTASSATSPTIYEETIEVSGAVTVCASGVVVLDGKLDLNGDRKADANDDGWFEGYPVIDGKIDVDRSGTVDGNDNALVAGYAVNAGLVDLLGTGAPVTGDELGTRITGAAFAGSGSGDCILAGAGSDRLHGVDGGDHLDGGDGADHLEGNRGNDFLRGGQGDDTAWGGDGADEIHGDSGADKLYGGAGPDKVFGGPGHDYIEGNQDGDELAGGADDDIVIGGSSSRTHPSTRSASGTLATAAGDDTIHGDGGRDLAFGDNVHIHPTTGALDFGTPGSLHGNDEIFGGPDDDVLIGLLGGDLVEGGDGLDHLAGDIARIALPAGGWGANAPAWHALVFPSAAPGAGPTHWPGGAPKYDVTLVLPDTGGNDHLFGNDGDDHVHAGAGNDYVEGGFGDDYLEGNGGRDEIYGLAKSFDPADFVGAVSTGGVRDQDVILGGSSGAHPTMLSTGASDAGDVIRGNLAQDVILGDNGTIVRQTTDATTWATDSITGGHARTVTLDDRDRTDQAAVSGDDIVLGDEANDRIYGTGGNDHLRGNDGDDYVEGNQGADWLEGNDGDDDLIGGSSCAGTATSCTGDPDGGDLVFGGRGQDVAAGDNAVIRRTSIAAPYLTTGGRFIGFTQHRWVNLLDTAASAAATRSGPDRVSGGADNDVLFGQGGEDWVSGGPGEDYMEGNGASDGMFGDRLLSAVGGVAKVRERFRVTAPADADVLAVPAGLKTLDAALTVYGLDPRLDGGGLFIASALRDLEGILDDPGTDEGQLDGQDDMTGGGRIAGSPDGHDLMWGDGEPDAMTGDNAEVLRSISGGQYVRHDAWYAPGTTDLPGGYGQRAKAIVRNVTLHDEGASVPTSATAPLIAASQTNAWGDDFMDGLAGEDVMFGQDGHDEMWGGSENDLMTGNVGDDRIYGQGGDDGMLGSRGTIIRRYVTAGTADFPATTLQYNEPPFMNPFDLWVTGRLHHVVTIPITTGRTAVQLRDGDDLMRGGPGRDAIHGGAGNDRMNGDSGGDAVFGGDGDDVMWGGKGDPAGGSARGYTGDAEGYVDRLYGGHGMDKMDIRPQEWWQTDTQLKSLYPLWDAAVKAYNHPDGEAVETTRQHHQGVDWIYGGFDADVLQADVSDVGPNHGDRLIDWTGAYNLYTACPSDYGGFNHIRSMHPEMLSLLERLAHADGAGATLADVQTATSAAYRNLALVYTKDNSANSGKAYGDEFGKTPGHKFEQGITCPDE